MVSFRVGSASLCPSSFGFRLALEKNGFQNLCLQLSGLFMVITREGDAVFLADLSSFHLVFLD